jgi:flagellin-like hook-associated protein FlgL
MACSGSQTTSALAFIDAIIADMHLQLERHGSHQKFDMQLAFISKLRAQIEKNSLALKGADFSEELIDLRKLQLEHRAFNRAHILRL